MGHENALDARSSPHPKQIRQVILKLAKENQWGYTRILGELKKLGVRSISRNTVKRILKDAGYDPGPKRGEGTWDEFIKQHAASLWQCDFFSKRILTLKGVREAFVIAFLNVKTRQVILSSTTLHRNEEWVVTQAESFVKQARGSGLPITYVRRDRDTKFPKSFDAKLKSLRLKTKPGAYRCLTNFAGDCLRKPQSRDSQNHCRDSIPRRTGDCRCCLVIYSRCILFAVLFIHRTLTCD